MKDFVRAPGRLASLPLAARVVYTVFLVFTLAGLALSALLGAAMVGQDLSGTQAYYAGKSAKEDRAAKAPADEAEGPVLDLPEEALEPSGGEPMALRKLLEITHFHLFSMPVYLLILSHLFMLSRMAQGPKIAWIVAASLATLLHMAAPWMVRASLGGSVPLYALSGALLLLTFLVMSLVPLAEMWLPPRK